MSSYDIESRDNLTREDDSLLFTCIYLWFYCLVSYWSAVTCTSWFDEWQRLWTMYSPPREFTIGLHHRRSVASLERRNRTAAAFVWAEIHQWEASECVVIIIEQSHLALDCNPSICIFVSVVCRRRKIHSPSPTRIHLDGFPFWWQYYRSFVYS